MCSGTPHTNKQRILPCTFHRAQHENVNHGTCSTLRAQEEPTGLLRPLSASPCRSLPKLLGEASERREVSLRSRHESSVPPVILSEAVEDVLVQADR